MTGYNTGCRPAHQEKVNHSFSFIHIHRWCSNGSNLGLSIFPKYTSTCGLEEPGIEPPIFQMEDDHSHSRTDVEGQVNTAVLYKTTECIFNYTHTITNQVSLQTPLSLPLLFPLESSGASEKLPVFTLLICLFVGC